MHKQYEETIKQTIKENKEILDKDDKINKFKNEIKNLNRTLENKAINHKKELKNIENRYEILLELKRRELNEMIDILNQKEEIIKNNIQLIKHYRKDYNNFQIVREYEKKKEDLFKKNINVLSYNNKEFQDLRTKRNYIVHVESLK